jgi:hypothetical protein
MDAQDAHHDLDLLWELAEKPTQREDGFRNSPVEDSMAVDGVQSERSPSTIPVNREFYRENPQAFEEHRPQPAECTGRQGTFPQIGTGN